MQIHLLHIIPSMDPLTGGPSQGLKNLDKSCEQLGIHREIVCLDDPEADFLSKFDFPIHAIGERKTQWQYSSKLYPWLMDNLHRFDAVVVNAIWLYHSYAVRKAVKLLQEQQSKNRHSTLRIPKVFIMPHGMLDPYFQHGVGRKLKAVRNWFYWKFIESKNISRADGVLFTCQRELTLARNTFTPYKPKKEINIGYGTEELPAYTSTIKDSFLDKCPQLKGEPYLLYLGRLDPKKGTELLVTAYIQLYKLLTAEERKLKLPKLLIAGPGIESPYGQHLLKLTLAFPEIKESIFFTGMITGNTKAGALWGCEALILPSHQENFGIVVAEALSCAKPVLISDKVNIYAEIELAQAGFIASDNLEGTLSLLKRWINLSSAEKMILQKNAANCYKANFDVKNAARKLQGAIQPD